MLLLAPDLRARVLELEAVGGAELMAERTLRAVAYAGSWAEQRIARATGSEGCSVHSHLLSRL
ncbi:hypothetical protein AB3662_06470 [Sorangium cellulosum]|uniref:hypothetical protein n=1 Tax=Sorangium cellulosum TaxID=56 RepID=UPI003D9A1B42